MNIPVKIEHLNAMGCGVKGVVNSVEELATKPFVSGDFWAVNRDVYVCDGQAWVAMSHHDRLTDLFPTDTYGDFAILVRQLAEFVQHRKVKLLTRKANSKKDSHVAYETVFPQDVTYGNAQLFMRCDEDKVVAAVNVTETTKVFEDFWNKEPKL